MDSKYLKKKKSDFVMPRCDWLIRPGPVAEAKLQVTWLYTLIDPHNLEPNHISDTYALDEKLC